ncbi:MAG: hypothetical protein WBB65_14025 [Anaerolineales bacterium]
MNKKMVKNPRWWYFFAALVLALGCLIAAMLFNKSGLGDYPSLIAEAYKDPLQKVEIPGEADLKLSRKGAYAIYCERPKGSYIQAEWPPALDCSLTSKTTGEDVPLVADYVPSNQYSTKDGDQVGMLLYSTTVEDIGLHTLSCDFADGRLSPKLVLAVGPNYFFEFLRVAWNLGGSVLGGVGVLCASSTLAVVIAVAVFLTRRKTSQASREVEA